MARITHPNPQLGSVKDRVETVDGPVIFIDGVAEVDLTDKPILHGYYVEHGYGIDYDIDELADDVEVDIPLSTLTIKELRKVAADNEVEIPKALERKKEIVEHVETALAARRLADEGGVPPQDVAEAAAGAVALSTFAEPETSGEAYIPANFKLGPRATAALQTPSDESPAVERSPNTKD